MPYVTNRPRTLATLLLLAGGLIGSSGQAQPAGNRLDEDDVVREAMGQNPDLRASLLDQQQASEQVIAEDGTYVPRLLLDTGVTHTESPRLTGDSTTVSSSDSIDVGSELQHTFPWGTALSVRVEGNRSSSTSQFGAGTDQLVTTGPGYGILGRVSVVQPLLRGFGTDVGESGLRQAQLSRTAAERTRDQLASQTLRDSLIAYWELWYAERAVGIEVEALELARRSRDETSRRIEAGAGAPVDVFSFETRVADLEQSVLGADTRWRQQSLSLGLLLGRELADTEELHAAADSVPPVPERNRDEVMKAAVDESLAVAQQQAQLDIQRDRALTAGEQERARLDLEAYLQAQGLGNQSVPPALEQFATFGAVSAHVGLVFELPLSGTRRSAQRRAAEVSADAARERLHAAEQRAKTEAATELVTLTQAQRKVDLAAALVELSERNAKAQQRRFEAGDAIALEVNSAEDDLRRAKLNLQRALVDARQASIRLDHLTGELLRRFAALVPDAPSKMRSRAAFGMQLGRF